MENTKTYTKVASASATKYRKRKIKGQFIISNLKQTNSCQNKLKQQH